MKGRAIRTKTLMTLLVIIGIIGGTLYSLIFIVETKPSRDITNFDQCRRAGYPVMESYPERCSANGETFTNYDQVAPTPTQ